MRGHHIPHTAETKEKMRQAKLGKHMSPATEFKAGQKPSPNRTIHSGESHYKWSETPSYSAVHAWINKTLGKPKLCSNCGFTSDNGRQFHWANISGNYLRDIADWVRLCVSCHFKMDKIHLRGWKTRKEKQCA